jgi:NAD(P)-dependent dehydrogenase (short-subunit alcohol dehydrogenase family)
MRNIVLSGATGKLGQNVLKRFSASNRVIVLARDTVKAKRILSGQPNVFFYECDLSNYEQIIKACDAILHDFARIDILINNAALDIDQPMLDTAKADFECIMKVNAFAPYYLCQKIISNMIMSSEGRIINVSSNLGQRSKINATEYSMSKAALDSLTRSIAVEYGPFGITANSISIGGMGGLLTKVNESNDYSADDNAYSDWKQPANRIPLRRRGSFKEFTDVIEYLCSNNSSYVNGVNISVDGGIMAGLE